jgi:hypothetical protein
MARWQLTIEGIGSGIPALVIDEFDDDGYARSQLGWQTLSEFTADADAVIAGPTAAPRYVWNIAALLPKAKVLQLEAIALWANSQYRLQQAPVIQFIDEIEEVPPEATPSKTLLADSEVVTSWGWTYGFGVFNVKLEIPETHKFHTGALADDDQKLVTFTVLELP